MTTRDYYEVLGVARDAGADEIRKAYRQVALKHHPDRNPGDAEAEHLFKEATQAYSVLSDADKRQLYDRFGHAGVTGRGSVDYENAGVGDIFSHFQDLFSDFFGAGGGGGRQRGPARGQDLRVDVVLDFADMLTGVKREVAVKSAVQCESCHGAGGRAGSKPQTCKHCGGQGQVASQRGFIVFSAPCGVCRGQGRVLADPCPTCRGRGMTEKDKSVLVTFPPGIDAGVRLRISGQGMPGPQGAPPGDLYVDVGVKRHEYFERDGYDLLTRENLSFAEAALGSELELDLPDGTTARVEVPAGTQPGTILTAKGRGIPRLDGHGRGNLRVIAEVEVPRKLTKQARALLLELDRELQTKARKTAS